MKASLRGAVGCAAAVLAGALAGPAAASPDAWREGLRVGREALERGALEMAEHHLEDAVSSIRKIGPQHFELFTELQVLGAVRAQDGQYGKGLRLVRRAHDLATVALGPGAARLEPFWSMLGAMELDAGNTAAAVEYLGRSYRSLMGNVSADNDAFREVLRNYAAALHRAGRGPDLAMLRQRYGHEVDLGGSVEALAAAPPTAGAAPPPPPRRHAPPARGAARPAPAADPGVLDLRRGRARAPARPRPSPVASTRRDRRTMSRRQLLTSGATTLPPLPPTFPPVTEFNPAVIQRQTKILRAYRNQIPDVVDTLKRHDEWLSMMLRRFPARRRPKRAQVAAAKQEIQVKGRQIAVLGKLALVLRAAWQNADSESTQELLRAMRPDIERFDRVVNRISSRLKTLTTRVYSGA